MLNAFLFTNTDTKDEKKFRIKVCMTETKTTSENLSFIIKQISMIRNGMTAIPDCSFFNYFHKNHYNTVLRQCQAVLLLFYNRMLVGTNL